MEHTFYSDGDTKKISWVIKTDNSKVQQDRGHADIYIDKVSLEQSKYIALHVGIFWAIGTFLIKNDDVVNIMIDSKTMYDHLANNSQISDHFIEIRTSHINQLIDQRKLKVKYHFVNSEENLASKLLKIKNEIT